jgi:hypothetical protein
VTAEAEPTAPETDAPDPAPSDDPKPKQNDVKAMEAALRKANREAADARAKLKELEDRDKSDSEKLTERIAAAEKRADDAEAKALRLEVATAKGLTATQARRLVGTTQDELEADADDLLASFKPGVGASPPGKPTEQLSGGGDPTEDPPVDMRKVIDAIPRGV